eukprot:Skav216330  [mRNA]  locus=scaffold3350:191632:192846:+ [translate_table: standard]
MAIAKSRFLFARPWQLVRDMRQALILATDGSTAFPDRAVAPHLLRDFVRRAKDIDKNSDPEDRCEIVRVAGSDPEGYDALLLQFTREVRKEALYGNETQLLRILRSLIGSVNRQKIQRALETDAQLQMEHLVRDLLSASIPRLKMRHQHLPLLQVSMCLSSYAEMGLQHREMFEVFGKDLVERINRLRQRPSIEVEAELVGNLPFILASYANASVVHPELFETSLSWCEEKIEMTL